MAVGLLLPTLITVELTPSIRGLLLGLVVLLLFGLWDDRVNLTIGPSSPAKCSPQDFA